jgi:hypothetical protein
VVRPLSLPIYPWGKELLVPSGRRLGEPHSWSGCYKDEKNISMLNILIYSSTVLVIGYRTFSSQTALNSASEYEIIWSKETGMDQN